MTTTKKRFYTTLLMIFSICLAVVFVISLMKSVETKPEVTVSESPVASETAEADEVIDSAEDLPYDRSWFESRKANEFAVTDDNGVTCVKTIRYELMKRQSTEFIWVADCSGIETATVQDWYTGEYLTVSGNGNEFETEHIIPFSLLFDAFGRYIQESDDQALGYELYYDWDNMVAASKSLNAGKSDRIGPEVMEIVCPDVSYDCSVWDSPYASGEEYLSRSDLVWEKWEEIAAAKGW